MTNTGTIAANFTLPDNMGGQITLFDQQPQNTVLFFYPKDDTPGCTTESKEFSHHLPDFTAANTVVFGISKDSVASHDTFQAKYGLAVPLLSDHDSDVCEQYGVWAEKNNFGKKYMGIVRSTFLINGQGEIVRVWRKVRVPGHVAEVLEAARSL